MSLISSCCCGSSGGVCAANDNFAKVVRQLGRPIFDSVAVEYNFPANYTMKLRAPLELMKETCSFNNACKNGSGPGGCVACGPSTPCCANCLADQLWLHGTVKHNLLAYKFEAFQNIEQYTQIYRFDSTNPDPLIDCSSLPTNTTPLANSIFFNSAIGNIAWDQTQTITNLGTFNSVYNDGKWGKWYDGFDFQNAFIPNHIPRDNCKWTFSAPVAPIDDSDLAPTFMGFKQAFITTSPGPTFTNVYQSLGYMSKSEPTLLNPQTGNCNRPNTLCSQPCANPCIAIFLRVRIESALKRRTGFTFDQAYIPVLGLQGNSTNPYPGNVSTIGYYRKYWDGAQTIKEFMDAPLYLYQIQGGASGYAAGGPFGWDNCNNSRSAQRQYTFASSWLSGDCKRVTGCNGFCVCSGGNCTAYPVINVGQTSQCQGLTTCAPITPIDCDCNNHIASFCDGFSDYIKTDCGACSFDNPLYNSNGNCKVCTQTTVSYETGACAPGGATLGQGVLDNMPRDWEDMPLSISPVYNPYPPILDRVTVKNQCNTYVVPAFGTLAGFTPIILEGKHLAYASSVLVGGVPCTGVEMLDNGRTFALTPPSATTGAKLVTVTTPGGTAGCATCYFNYTNNAPPQICTSLPYFGPWQGVYYRDIYGYGFTGATSVTIGGINCFFSVYHSGLVKVLVPTCVPPGVAATRPIIITSPYGVSNTADFVYDCSLGGC